MHNDKLFAKGKKYSDLLAFAAVCIIVLIIVGMIVIGALYGKREQITYEGKVYRTNTVEEIISDKLEVENPGLDIEVIISTSQED